VRACVCVGGPGWAGAREGGGGQGRAVCVSERRPHAAAATARRALAVCSCGRACPPSRRAHLDGRVDERAPVRPVAHVARHARHITHALGAQRCERAVHVLLAAAADHHFGALLCQALCVSVVQAWCEGCGVWCVGGRGVAWDWAAVLCGWQLSATGVCVSAPRAATGTATRHERHARRTRRVRIDTPDTRAPATAHLRCPGRSLRSLQSPPPPGPPAGAAPGPWWLRVCRVCVRVCAAGGVLAQRRR
jgi:hypothetical protein